MSDASGVTSLLQQSYPRLLAADYERDVLQNALPLMVQANPSLLASGTYFVAEGDTGRILGAGGWTRRSPTDGGASVRGGHIRHVATHPDALRQGVARSLMRRILSSAKAMGAARLHCLSTRTAVPFYKAMGFVGHGAVTVHMGPGVRFPAVEMLRLH
jgi:GNAT superfamily N-acetyltransferase